MVSKLKYSVPFGGINYDKACTSVKMEYEQKEDYEEEEEEEEEEEVQRLPIVGELAENRSQLCRVCHREGATYHYGGTVCAGCKIFFSRSVREDRNYSCRKGGLCYLDGQKKGGKCQGCRFASCLKAGMQRENVGKLLLLRSTEQKNTNNVQEENELCAKLSIIPPTSIFISTIFSKSSVTSVEIQIQRLINLEKSKENQSAMPFAHRFKRKFNANLSFSDSLNLPQQICEPVPMQYISSKFFGESLADNLKWFWCRNTSHFLEWASAIDDLMSLNVREIETILKNRMISIMTLVTCFRLMNTSTIVIDFELFIRSCSEIVEPMERIELKLEEMVILKLILLFDDKPEYKRKYYNLLRLYLKKQYSDDECIERLIQLLQILTSVRQISNQIDNWLFLLCITNQYEMRSQLIEEFHVKP